MRDGSLVGIFICPVAGQQMEEVEEVEAIAGAGLRGDRYAIGEGSFNHGASGKRQVTLINALFFEGSGFDFADSRRNLMTSGVELMWLIGREFQIGTVRFRGVKYCDPCARPSKLAGKKILFKDTFFDRGGLIAEILEGGMIKKGDPIILPSKGY